MKSIDIIISKLRTLDEAAADYVQDRYNKGRIAPSNIINDKYAITYLFSWSYTPQGINYWNDLYYKYTRLPITTLKGNVL